MTNSRRHPDGHAGRTPSVGERTLCVTRMVGAEGRTPPAHRNDGRGRLAPGPGRERGATPDPSDPVSPLGSALGESRTPNRLIRSQVLYPLSYERWFVAATV